MILKMSEQGIIFDISRACLNDGPGIRTTVFLKGCPLKCAWCHNPESQNIKPEILYSQSKCINCGRCIEVCPNNCHSINDIHAFTRNLCIGCGECTKACVAGALRLAGRYCTVDEVMHEVIRDKAYYEDSGGGLTVSGGEPMMQIDFLERLLKAARQEEINTCIETCGYAPKDAFARIATLTDCFLFDWKESNAEKHQCFTGVSNALIRENLEFLDSVGANIILRLPLIPGYNDTTEHLHGIRNVIQRFHSIQKVEVLPYHPLGVSKEVELGRSKKGTINVPEKVLLENFIKSIGDGLDITVEACI